MTHSLAWDGPGRNCSGPFRFIGPEARASENAARECAFRGKSLPAHQLKAGAGDIPRPKEKPSASRAKPFRPGRPDWPFCCPPCAGDPSRQTWPNPSTKSPNRGMERDHRHIAGDRRPACGRGNPPRPDAGDDETPGCSGPTASHEAAGKGAASDAGGGADDGRRNRRQPVPPLPTGRRNGHAQGVPLSGPVQTVLRAVDRAERRPAQPGSSGFGRSAFNGVRPRRGGVPVYRTLRLGPVPPSVRRRCLDGCIVS